MTELFNCLIPPPKSSILIPWFINFFCTAWNSGTRNLMIIHACSGLLCLQHPSIRAHLTREPPTAALSSRNFTKPLHLRSNPCWKIRRGQRPYFSAPGEATPWTGSWSRSRSLACELKSSRTTTRKSGSATSCFWAARTSRGPAMTKITAIRCSWDSHFETPPRPPKSLPGN